MKHFVLTLCLEHLKRKPTGFVAFDAHGGGGRYDLQSEEALRGDEWRDAIGRLWEWTQAPAALTPYLAAVRALNADGALRFYPGSPLLIRAALRPQDRLIVSEAHPEEVAALKRLFREDAQTAIHHRDAWEALGALPPPEAKRVLTLIDPPYETPGELEQAASAVRAAIGRRPGAVILWWRPLKNVRAVAAIDAGLRPMKALRVDLAVAGPETAGALQASSLLIANPPHTLSSALTEALPALAARLARGSGGYACVEALGPL